jgi:DNA-binding response OmpR family regulator
VPVTPKRRHHILVAEDDAAVRKMIGHFLEEIADVTTAKDGMEALGFLRDMEKAPDLIITDLMMPRLDGLGLLKRVRANETSKDIPIIILTAKAQPMDVVTGINAGARHYLIKPFKREELLEKVRRVLRLD